jgi:hypothetical protein
MWIFASAGLEMNQPLQFSISRYTGLLFGRLATSRRSPGRSQQSIRYLHGFSRDSASIRSFAVYSTSYLTNLILAIRGHVALE